MGMTIDDYIKIIKGWLHKGTDGLTNTKLGYIEGWFHKSDKEAFEVAIETMRKYQKIQDIYLKWNRNYNIQTSSAWTEVIEVIEDGKID